MERDTAYERRQQFRARRRAPASTARTYGGLDPSTLDEDSEPPVAASNAGQTPNASQRR